MRGVDTGGWESWWDANGAALVGRHTVRTRVTADNPLFRVGGGESGNRADTERPTEKAIEDEILPTLRWVLDPKNGCDDDTVAAAHLAIGKTTRDESDVKRLLDSCRRRNASTMVHECAALSLGLLRRTSSATRFDGRLLDQARSALFATIDDDTLPQRTRCFAAFAAGLLGDQGSASDARSHGDSAVVRALWLRLDEKQVGEEIPVALLIALSLQPPAMVPTGVLDGLRGLAVTGFLNGRRYGSLTRGQALVALARLSDSTGAGVFLGLLRGRSVEGPVKRAAIVSLGIAAQRLEPMARRDAALALCETFNRGDDADTLGLMLVSLGRLLAADAKDGCTALIDSTLADDTLLHAARLGRAEVRPFGALALGIAGRGFDSGSATEPAATFRDHAIAALHEGASDERTDPSSRGAYCLGLGLIEDESAITLLRSIASRRGASEDLRGFACLSIGLVGRPTPEAVQTLRAALRERSSDELRRQAAAGLGHLGDVSAVPLLLADLQSGGSDHVLAQVVMGLGTIADVRAVPGLMHIVHNTSVTDLVRAIACAGLGLLGDLEPSASLSRLGADSNYLTPTNALYEALSLL